MRKVIIWFVVVLILAIYAKVEGWMPSSGKGEVLGNKTTQPHFKITP